MIRVAPKISVIVPVYNVEKYLNRCIDSILAQTMTEFELLLIDDGSTDTSGNICDEYAIKDSRVEVLHKQNGGVSSARNFGLDNAHGRWVVFVDSDDWCEPNYLQDFLSLQDLSLLDIVIQGRINNDNIVSVKGGTYRDIAKGILDNDLLVFGAPYCKLYSRKLINENNVRFPLDYSYGEDTTFFFKVLNCVKRMIVIEKYNYHYMANSGTSLSKKDHDYLPLEHFLMDSMAEVSKIDDKYNAHMTLIKAYTPHYRDLILRSIANMYRLGYDGKEKATCINRIKKKLLPCLKPSKDIVVCALRFIPVSWLRIMFGVIMRFRK